MRGEIGRRASIDPSVEMGKSINCDVELAVLGGGLRERGAVAPNAASEHSAACIALVEGGSGNGKVETRDMPIAFI